MEQIEIKDPYGFIYITTNLINGKRYIGQKKFDNGSRWKSYLGSGFHLQKAIQKYGKENFIRNIVDIAYSLEELNEKENYWIENYNAVESNDFYNMVEGGNVADSLKKRNSIPIVCLNNKMKFNSINDASIWSGHTTLTIKKTFEEKYTKFTKKLIFRPLDTKCCVCGELFFKSHSRENKCDFCKEYYLCKGCGKTFRRIKQRQIRCDPCQKKADKINARNRQRKHRQKQHQ